MSSYDWKTRLESQLSRMNCQMFSTGLSSGDFGGSGIRVMLAGMSSLSERRQPAWSRSSTAWAPGVTVREISARCSAIAALLRRGRAFPGDEAGGGSLGRADGAEDIGQSGALIVRGRGSRRAHRRVILFFWPIRERSPGSFELRYSLGTDAATGKRRMANVTVRGTRKDAEKELRRLLRSVDTGEHVDPTRVTVREWLATWLAAIREEVSPKTH